MIDNASHWFPGAPANQIPSPPQPVLEQIITQSPHAHPISGLRLGGDTAKANPNFQSQINWSPRQTKPGLLFFKRPMKPLNKRASDLSDQRLFIFILVRSSSS